LRPRPGGNALANAGRFIMEGGNNNRLTPHMEELKKEPPS
jgi:hypothetical protein